MSYVVLARKYRPRNFEQMVGQEHVVKALTNALEQRRLHHAYLFTGTRGVGKTTVSRILAKSLNCTGADGTGGITSHPCGRCSACVEIDADRYIDYIELDAASNRSIDEIRDLIERSSYKPGVGRYKVFMIDEAHQLTKDAFNALLKTLEEPPEYLKFVLATTDPEKMLPTVLSRCLQFNLRPMAPETVRDHLLHVLQAEQVECDEASLRLLARAARGSMRDALSLTDQAIAHGGGRIEVERVRAMLGAVDRGHAAALVQALALRDGRALLETVDVLRRHGASALGTLDEMAQLLQQMAVEQALPGTLDPADPEQSDALALAGRLAADETQLLYGIVLQGRAELGLMSDEYGALTMVLLRMLAFPAHEGAGAASRAPGPRVVAAPAVHAAPAPVAPRGRAPAASGEPPPWLDAPPADDGGAALRVPSPPTLRVPAAAAPQAQRHAIGDRWAEVVARLIEAGAVQALVRELAWQAGLQAVEQRGEVAVWRLTVERDALRTDALRDRLAAALQGLLDEPLRVELEAGVPGDSPALRDAAERQRRQTEAEQTIRTDPAVQELMSQFKGARIVPGSVKPV